VNRSQMLASSLLLSVLVAIWACDDRVTAGNNGTSTDNVVTGRLLRVDSLADSLLDGDLGPYPLLLRLDRRNLDFSKSWKDGSDFRAQRPDSTALPYQIREWDSASGHASVWVRLDRFRRGSGQAIRVHLGKDSTANRSNVPATWSGVSDSVRLKVASILVDNFERGTTMSLLPCACDTWYARTSITSNPSSTAKLLLPAPGASFATALQATGTSHGKALHLNYANAVWTNQDWVLAGIRLGTVFQRMAGLDSITFLMRGNGNMHLALENGADTTWFSKAWLTLKVDTGWTRHVVKPSQFDPASVAAKTNGWMAVRDSITLLSFFAHDGSDLWIDDIRFWGMSPKELP